MSDSPPINSQVFQQNKDMPFTQWMRSSGKGYQNVGAGRIFNSPPGTIMYSGFNQYIVPKFGDQDNYWGRSETVCVFTNETSLRDSDTTDRAITFLRSFAQSKQPFSTLLVMREVMRTSHFLHGHRLR